MIAAGKQVQNAQREPTSTISFSLTNPDDVLNNKEVI